MSTLLAVEMGAGLLGQHGVTHDDQLLGDGGAALQPQLAGDAALVDGAAVHHGGVLAVAQHRDMQTAGTDEGVAHQIGVVHIHTVVGDGDGAGCRQRFGIGQLAAVQSHGDCADGVDVDAAALSFRLFDDVAYGLGAINDGLGVGHAGQTGHTAPGGSGGTGDNVFLVGETGVAQMDVHIHQTGGDAQAAGVDDPVDLHIQTALEHGNLAVLDIQVLHQHNAGDRVDDSSVFDQNLHIVPPFSNWYVSAVCEKGAKNHSILTINYSGTVSI